MESTRETLRSWVILCGVSFVTFSEAGLVKCFGVLLPELTVQLQSSTWIIGLGVTFVVGWGFTLGKLHQLGKPL